MVRSRMGGTVAGGNAGSWSPQDKVRALERLATARANLAGLERQAAPNIDPEIQAAVIERQQLNEQLRAEVGRRGRAGKQARQQVEALEGTQGLVMECLGYRSFEEFCTAIDRFDSRRVDGRVIDAARQEVDRAERHFFDTAEMRIPVPTPPVAAAPLSRPAPPPPAAPVRRAPAPTPLPRGPRPVQQAPRPPRPIAAPPRWAAG
jgi:hypothetical protein